MPTPNGPATFKQMIEVTRSKSCGRVRTALPTVMRVVVRDFKGRSTVDLGFKHGGWVSWIPRMPRRHAISMVKNLRRFALNLIVVTVNEDGVSDEL